MHTTASSLVAIAQYFLIFLYGNQQKFNIQAVNDYPPIRDSIRTEISDLYSYIGVCKYLGCFKIFPLGHVRGGPIISVIAGARKLKLKTQLDVVKCFGYKHFYAGASRGRRAP